MAVLLRVDTTRRKKLLLGREKGPGQPPELSLFHRGFLAMKMLVAHAADVQVHRRGVLPQIACLPLPCAV